MAGATWLIAADKLYLNYNHGTVRRFLRDVPGNIVKADRARRAQYG
ncbi:MAG: hypothetical protein AAF371_09570 [Pseudomonadota bacterium]